jgi:4-amino-4-deoxy-L-arabinose transferase-like glycosyltransferase
MDLTVLLIVFGTLFLQFLGRIPLFEPDEGRYAEIPREMLERGDFITPMLNYVKYFEKPALHYWLDAISQRLFGQNEFAARLPGAVAGLLCVLFVYHLGRKLFDRRTGFLAALILGTCTGFMVMARINLTDMTLTCCLTLALGCFILAAREGEEHKGFYYYLAYIFAALAVLAKGLIGIVFPGAIIFLFCLLGREWRLLKEMRIPTGLLLFLLVAAPWFILVSLHNPEFPNFFFIHEHFQRFTTTVHNRYQPFWFFAPVLLGTMLPWSFFIPSGLRGTWLGRRSPQGREALFLAIWVVFIFLFFSKSNSKLVPYILPLFPPLSILIARAFSARIGGTAVPLKLAGTIMAIILCLGGITLFVYPHVSHRQEFSPLGGAAMGALFFIEGVLAYIWSRRNEALYLFLSLCICSYAISLVAPPIILEGVTPRKSSKELCLKVKELAGPDDAVAVFGYEQALPYYAKRRVIVIGGRGELEFGSNQGDQSAWFMQPEQFASIWDGQKKAFVLANESDVAKLKTLAKTPVHELGRNRRRVLISNR